MNLTEHNSIYYTLQQRRSLRIPNVNETNECGNKSYSICRIKACKSINSWHITQHKHSNVKSACPQNCTCCFDSQLNYWVVSPVFYMLEECYDKPYIER